MTNNFSSGKRAFNTNRSSNLSFNGSEDRRPRNDGFIHTGYNNGFTKGSFATQLNGKEYFEIFIRPKNSEKFGDDAREKKKTIAKATFIGNEKKDKEPFADAVKRHLKVMEEAEAKEEAEKRKALESELPVIDPQKQLTVDVKNTRFSVDFGAAENLKSALLRKGTMTRRLAISNTPHYMK